MKMRTCLILGTMAGAGWLPGLRGQPSIPSGQAYVAVNAFPNLTFVDPTCMVPVPKSNELLVGGREGTLWTFVNSPSTTTKTVFLDLSAHTQGWSDSGVLGVAFHPQFGQAGSPNRGYVYVWYCYTPGPLVGSAAAPPNYTTPCFDRLSRFTVPDGSSVADPNSEYVLINQFDRDLWHNGGAMFFGSDGYLYVTDGDEGGVADQYQMSQKINVGLFGGVLRIDVNENAATGHPIRRQPQADPNATIPAGWGPSYTQGYYIPNDNPFQDPTGGTLEEFWALGLRSPHRMTLDSVTGTIWLGDVGQDKYEEVDLVAKGGNYEWGFMEGFSPGPDPRPATLIGVDSPPIYVYPHLYSNGCVIGGYVYRGSKFPALAGLYIYGDYDSGRIWSMSYSGSGTPVVNYLGSVPMRESEVGGLASFAQDANNELYVLTIGPNGIIYTLAAPGSGGHLINLSTSATAGAGAEALAAGFVTAGGGSKQFLVRGVGPTLSEYNVASPLADPLLTLSSGTTGSLIAENNHWCSGGNEAALAAAATSCGAFALPANSDDSALMATVGAGEYVAQVSPNTGSSGTALAEVYDLTPSASESSGPQLLNLSSRSAVGPNDNLVGGFVIGGSAPMTVLIRGVGPTLVNYGVTNPLPSPLLTLFDGSGNVITTNTAWQSLMGSSIATVEGNVGAFPLTNGSNDAALLVTLAPGSYTAQVSTNDGNSGVALVEIYAVP